MTDRKPPRKKPPRPNVSQYAIVVALPGGEQGEYDEAAFKRHPGNGAARAKVDAVGLESIIEATMAGAPLRMLAEQIGVGLHTLWLWLNATPERKEAYANVRREAAQTYDEMGEEVLIKALKGQVDGPAAAQLAQHYRWRAKVVNPPVYGDRVEHEHQHKLSFVEALKQVRDRQAARKLNPSE